MHPPPTCANETQTNGGRQGSGKVSGRERGSEGREARGTREERKKMEMEEAGRFIAELQ